MSVNGGSSAIASPLRGDFHPTEQMERLQESYLGAVAAAAGCSIWTSKSDDGIDALIKHKSRVHSRGLEQVLMIQLKATSQFQPGTTGTVSAQFSRRRFDEFAEPNPSLHKIVVIMVQPQAVVDWIDAQHSNLLTRHCCYWVNIAGKTDPADRPYVHASRSDIFDDIALCGIMARIGQGVAP